MANTQLTVLNGLAGREIADALDQHVSWGLRWVDLKDDVFGKKIEDISSAEASQLRDLLDRRNLKTYCLSSVLMGDEVEKGETHFRGQLTRLDHLLNTASLLQPKYIRLLAPQTRVREMLSDSCHYLRSEQNWLFDVFRAAIDRVRSAGYFPIIENEVGKCIFAAPREILDFFRELRRDGQARLTWDIQNLWQMGTFPSLEVYAQLIPVLGMVHVKGGQCGDQGKSLEFSSALEDASWPVVPIIQRVVEDGTSPVICINASHGVKKPGYDYSNIQSRDIAFLRQIKGIE